MRDANFLFSLFWFLFLLVISSLTIEPIVGQKDVIDILDLVLCFLFIFRNQRKEGCIFVQFAAYSSEYPSPMWGWDWSSCDVDSIDEIS